MRESLKKHWIYYVAFFFLILGMFYYSKAYGYDHFTYDSQGKVYFFQNPSALEHIDTFLETQHVDMHQLMKYFRTLAYDDCKTNAQKVQFHKENGERTFKDAKDRCWWLPDVSDRDNARYCFTTFGILAGPGEPKSKIIIALVNALIQYGLNCSDEWHYVNNKLYWSQYHFEMMEFHQDLIKHGYP